MTQCPGLIPCTPPPTPGPTGLTAHELATLADAAGTLLAIALGAGLVFLVVTLAVAAWMTTR